MVIATSVVERAFGTRPLPQKDGTSLETGGPAADPA
jgi:hypothetical protein